MSEIDTLTDFKQKRNEREFIEKCSAMRKTIKTNKNENIYNAIKKEMSAIGCDYSDDDSDDDSDDELDNKLLSENTALKIKLKDSEKQLKEQMNKIAQQNNIITSMPQKDDSLKVPGLQSKINRLTTELAELNKIKIECDKKQGEIYALNQYLETQKQLNTDITKNEAAKNAKLIEENQVLNDRYNKELTELKSKIEKLQENLKNCNETPNVSVTTTSLDAKLNTPVPDDKLNQILPNATNEIELFKPMFTQVRTLSDILLYPVLENRLYTLQTPKDIKWSDKEIKTWFNTQQIDKKTNIGFAEKIKQYINTNYTDYILNIEYSNNTKEIYKILGAVKYPNSNMTASYINTYLLISIKPYNTAHFISYKQFEQSLPAESSATAQNKPFMGNIIKTFEELQQEQSSVKSRGGQRKPTKRRRLTKRCGKNSKKKTRKYRH